MSQVVPLPCPQTYFDRNADRKNDDQDTRDVVEDGIRDINVFNKHRYPKPLHEYILKGN